MLDVLGESGIRNSKFTVSKDPRTGARTELPPVTLASCI